MPFPYLAGAVSVVEIVDIADLADAEARVADVAEWLDRQGVTAEGSVVKAHGDVTIQLDAIAGQKGAGLIVAGAYGHTRLREWVFGGVTQQVLMHPRRCTLVSHRWKGAPDQPRSRRAQTLNSEQPSRSRWIPSGSGLLWAADLPLLETIMRDEDVMEIRRIQAAIAPKLLAQVIEEFCGRAGADKDLWFTEFSSRYLAPIAGCKDEGRFCRSLAQGGGMPGPGTVRSRTQQYSAPGHHAGGSGYGDRGRRDKGGLEGPGPEN